MVRPNEEPVTIGRLRVRTQITESTGWKTEFGIQPHEPRKKHMDKKSKKRIDVLRSNLQRLRQQFSGVQKQKDDPEESKTLANQIALIEAELQSLTGNQNPSSKR